MWRFLRSPIRDLGRGVRGERKTPVGRTHDVVERGAQCVDPPPIEDPEQCVPLLARLKLCLGLVCGVRTSAVRPAPSLC